MTGGRFLTAEVENTNKQGEGTRMIHSVIGSLEFDKSLWPHFQLTINTDCYIEIHWKIRVYIHRLHAFPCSARWENLKAMTTTWLTRHLATTFWFLTSFNELRIKTKNIFLREITDTRMKIEKYNMSLYNLIVSESKEALRTKQNNTHKDGRQLKNLPKFTAIQ